MAEPVQQQELIQDVFHSPPVYNAIFACLSPADIIRVGQTCQLLRGAVASFQKLAYNINRHLEHFVKDPVALRRIQARTKFLISGSNALQFLDRTFYPLSDLDIFAFPETAKDIGYHLIEKEGYIYDPGQSASGKFDEVTVNARRMDEIHRALSPADFVYNTGMTDLLRFKHPDKGLEIQVIACRRSPLDCVLYFHSTCVMNIITHDTAYALYPKATFDNRVALKFGYDHHDATKKAYDKYTQRGWTFVTDMSYASVKAVTPIFGPDVPRYLDDKYTWRAALDTTGLDLRPPSPISQTSVPKDASDPIDPFLCNSWELGRDFDGFSTRVALGMSYRVYHSPHLEDTYLFAENAMYEAVEQLITYLVKHNPARRGGMKYLDSYIPLLRKAHLNTPKHVRKERQYH